MIVLGKTTECLNLDPIKDKISGLGIKTFTINGHNIGEIISTLKKTDKINKLNCILATTIKGKGSSIMENKKKLALLE